VTDWFEETEAVRRHPRVAALGASAGEQLRAEAFAHDLAAWLAGAEREALRPLARVVTLVAGPVLRDARTICLGHPLLGVESGARMAETFWPLLRWADPEPPEAPPPEEQGGGGAPGGGGGGPGQSGSAQGGGEPGEGGGDGEEDGGDSAAPDADEVEARALRGADGLLRELSGEPELDEELQQLAARLAETGPAPLEQAAADGARAAWAGAKEGEELVRAVESLVPGIGWGAAPGTLQRQMLAKLEPFVALLDRLPELRRLADVLGRVESEARRQQQKAGGGEEVTGVALSGEVARALPSELGLLGDPELEDLFLLRWQERRLMSLELLGGGMDGVAGGGKRGPVIACVDTSGSMRGPPGVIAKAALLAVVRRVVPEGRAVHVLLFGSRGEQTELRLRRGAGLEDLLAFLALRFDGGTDFDTPLARALVLLGERDLQQADLLLVTDGMARASQAIEAAVLRAKAERGVRCFGVIVPGGVADYVAPLCDQTWCLDGGPAEMVKLVRETGALPGAW
jgi:uncharacterized protein with von Willebrand factor type A (vWA) domain